MHKSRAWTCVIGVVVLMAGMGACQSQPARQADTDYAAMFNSGRYAEAYDAASKAAGSLRGGNRETAALIAGQAAYRLGRAPDAEKWLRPLLDSSSGPIAGRASSTLGSLAMDRGENRQAAELFKTAGQKLTGDDSARALMYAGDAKAALGSQDDAQALYIQARDRVESDVSLRVQIGDRLATGGPQPSAGSAGQFTVQAGAMSTGQAAERLAAGLAHHGPSRIVPIARGGRTLYAVRVGAFATKSEAERVRAMIGKGAIVTTMSGE